MIKEAIAQLVDGHALTMDEASTVMAEIMGWQAPPRPSSAPLSPRCVSTVRPWMKIAGLARTMRSKALRVQIDEPVVDTCGTGGDASGTFNISTTAAFIVAACGLKLPSTVNRAMSSRCGSADVLEALGVKNRP